MGGLNITRELYREARGLPRVESVVQASWQAWRSWGSAKVVAVLATTALAVEGVPEPEPTARDKCRHHRRDGSRQTAGPGRGRGRPKLDSLSGRCYLGAALFIATDPCGSCNEPTR